MAAQIEVKFKGMSDAGIDCCPCRDVPTLSNLFFFLKKRSLNISIYMCLSIYLTIYTHPLGLVGTEEACVVAFLNNDISDAWLIVFLQLDARVSDGQELIMQDLHTKKKCSTCTFLNTFKLECLNASLYHLNVKRSTYHTEAN